MKKIAYTTLLLMCTSATTRGQLPTTPDATASASAPAKAAIPIKDEPHHHLLLENPYVRVFRVEVISPDATPLYLQDSPYVYMSIGKAQFTKAVEGQPEKHITMTNGQLGYSKGGFAQIIRAENDTPFYNITVELLHPQNNMHSECAKVIEGPLDGCATRAAVDDTSNKVVSSTDGDSAASPGTGANTPLAESAPDKGKKAAGPPVFASILESDESILKSGNFPANAKTSLVAAVGGTLLVVEPLSQFKVDFVDGSSKLLSGGDTLWLQAGSTSTATNTSEQSASWMLIFDFKDVPKKAAN
jgi:hypothetical protein